MVDVIANPDGSLTISAEAVASWTWVVDITPDLLRQVAEAIPNSSIPDVVSAIFEAVVMGDSDQPIEERSET